MKCHDIRKALAAAFDEGYRAGREVEEHLVSCGDCRNYRARLDTLANALDYLPLTTPSLGFDARIEEGLRQAASPWARLGAAAAILAILVGALIANWRYPLRIDLASWERGVSVSVPNVSWAVVRDTGASVIQAGGLLASDACATLSGLMGAAPRWHWSVVAGLALFWLGFNSAALLGPHGSLRRGRGETA